MALGAMHEVADIAGSTTLTPPGGTATTAPGGLLALPSNAGHHTRDEFAVVPEVGVTAGVHVTSRIDAFVGYTWLYASAVARPGDQIDRAVNPTQLPTSRFFTASAPGAIPPTFGFHGSDFWAQGISFGLALRC